MKNTFRHISFEADKIQIWQLYDLSKYSFNNELSFNL